MTLRSTGLDQKVGKMPDKNRGLGITVTEISRRMDFWAAINDPDIRSSVAYCYGQTGPGHLRNEGWLNLRAFPGPSRSSGENPWLRIAAVWEATCT